MDMTAVLGFVVAIAIIGGIGYRLYNRKDKPTSGSGGSGASRPANKQK